MYERSKVEQEKFDTFYSEPLPEDEEEVTCSYGFCGEECDGEMMRGNEYCEFRCPFGNLNEKENNEK